MDSWQHLTYSVFENHCSTHTHTHTDQLRTYKQIHEYIYTLEYKPNDYPLVHVNIDKMRACATIGFPECLGILVS